MAFTTTAVNAAVDGAVDGVTHVQLHDGDPGAAGTSNVAAEASAQTISFPSASSGSTSDEVTFAISGAGGPYGFVTLWVGDPGSGGTFRGSGAVSPAETFAGAGSLAATVTASGSSS